MCGFGWRYPGVSLTAGTQMYDLAAISGSSKRTATRRSRARHHLFEPSTTPIASIHNAWLRGYVYDFIELFAPKLGRAAVKAALSGSTAAATAAANRVRQLCVRQRRVERAAHAFAIQAPLR